MRLFPILAGVGAIGLIAYLSAGTANAAPVDSKAKAPPPDVLAKIKQAVDSRDPVAMEELARQLSAAGYTEQAASLRMAAKLILEEQAKVKPAPIGGNTGTPPDLQKAPKPAPVTTPTGVPVRMPAEQPKSGAEVFKAGEAGTITQPPAGPAKYIVKAGDNPSKIAKAITGNERRWIELIKANPQKKTKKTSIGSVFTTLNAGESLNLPEGWVPKA